MSQALPDPLTAATPGDGTVRPPHATALFLAFARMALQGFGGVLAIAQRELVDRLRWMTREQFLHDFSAAQLLPGPNVVNLSMTIGDRFFGWRGVVAAMAGMVGVPLVLVMGIVVLGDAWIHVPAVQGALRGMGLVSVALILATTLKLMGALKSLPTPRWQVGVVMVAVPLALLLGKWPLWAVLPLAGGISMALADRAAFKPSSTEPTP